MNINKSKFGKAAGLIKSADTLLLQTRIIFA